MPTQPMNAIKQLKRIGLKLNSCAFGASIGILPCNLTSKSLVYSGTYFFNFPFVLQDFGGSFNGV
jgi:hypothetical protein